MNALTSIHADTQASGTLETTGKWMLAKALIVGAMAGLVGSVAAGMSGALLTAASWLSVNEGARHWLSTAGSALLLLTIPLIIVGALCLDWMEKDQPQHRVAFLRDDDDEGESNV
ncbi:MAG TPA: hypothetical protein PLK30_06995 [Blastocatellia bacterium]|nr:hypothetical protein [Blastocatellia bacterium]